MQPSSSIEVSRLPKQTKKVFSVASEGHIHTCNGPDNKSLPAHGGLMTATPTLVKKQQHGGTLRSSCGPESTPSTSGLRGHGTYIPVQKWPAGGTFMCSKGPQHCSCQPLGTAPHVVLQQTVGLCTCSNGPGRSSRRLLGWIQGAACCSTKGPPACT